MRKGRPQRLSQEAVRDIRNAWQRWAAVERPAQIARRHGVHVSTLRQIVSGYIYKDAR